MYFSIDVLYLNQKSIQIRSLFKNYKKKKKKTLGSKKTKYIKSSVSVVENAMEKDDVGEREGAAKSFLIE